ARREREGLLQSLLKVDPRLLVELLQDEIVELQKLAQLLLEARGIEQILQADRAPRGLVLVGRTDAAAGGADLALALRRLARVIQRRVVGQDQRTGFGYRQPRHDPAHAGRLELVHLRNQRLGRNHHAVADEA